jgi:hypothetical protein
VVDIFARLAAESGKLGDELAARPPVKHAPDAATPLDTQFIPGRPPVLPHPDLDHMLWFWPQREYAKDYAERLYSSE